MDLNTVFVIASQETKINIRNKWTLIFAAVFGGLALAISYFGLVTAGVVGLEGFTRTAASLLNLVLYVIPMVALTMGTLTFTGERGSNELLFSQPVTRSEILVGRLLGLFLSIVTSTFLGFGLAGFVIAARMGADGLWPYLAFVALALLLALVFLVLGTMVALLAGNRTKAFGLSLFVWFFFVLFYDLLVIGLAFLLRERTANLFVFLSLFGNPVDMVRVSSLLALSGATIFGAAGAALLKFLGGATTAHLALLAGLFAWTFGSTLICVLLLRKQDV